MPGRRAAPAVHDEAFGLGVDLRAERPQHGRDGLDAVALLGAQLGRALHVEHSLDGQRRGHRERRHLVDQVGQLGGGDHRPVQLGASDAHDAGRPVDLEVGAHPLQHREEAGALGREVEALDGQVARRG